MDYNADISIEQMVRFVVANFPRVNFIRLDDSSGRMKYWRLWGFEEKPERYKYAWDTSGYCLQLDEINVLANVDWKTWGIDIDRTCEPPSVKFLGERATAQP